MRNLLLALLVIAGCTTPKRTDPNNNMSCQPAACDGQCGMIDDGCGGELDCGKCQQPCSQSDDDLCTAEGAECGKLSATDACGMSRTVASCGTCFSGESCGGGGKNRCGCVTETDAQMCARLGRNCGPLSGTDNCGKARAIASCGTCSGTTCGGTGTAGVCGCTPESNPQFCTRLGKNCGALSGTDNCGKARSVPSCGTCTSGTCGGSGVANVCGSPACVSESDFSFCLRYGRNCGSFSDADNCGKPRTVASCGTCTSPKTCGAIMPNICGCAAESDAAFCSRLGKNCGALSGTDNCGVSRTAVQCGTCTSPLTCGGGGMANVCGCSETDAQMCTRLGKTCGSITAKDVCGVTRTVTSCGTCSAPQSCGGSGTPNVCGCTGESDAAFCTRLNKNCGQVSAPDNCGVSRTVATCGTCSQFASCGGGGVANVCGGYAEPITPVCGGGYCWENPLPTGASLRGAKTSPSGSNWVVGAAGTVLRWNGSTWSGWFATTHAHLAAVWPFSDSDVWAVGTGGTIIRYNGATWATVASGTSADLHGLWGAPDGTLWAVGNGGTVLKRAPGGSFAPVAAGTAQPLNAVFGIGSDVWMVGGQVIVRWNGASFSSTSVAWNLTDVWGASTTDIWAASTSGMMRFTGTTWLQSTAANGYAVFGTSASNVWVASYSGGAYRFDGVTWTSTPIETAMFGNTVSALTGASASSLLAVGEHGVLFRYDGSKWWRLDKGVPATGGTTIMHLGEMQVLGGTAFASGSYQGSFTCCFGALLKRESPGNWSFGTRPTTTMLRGTGPTNLWGMDNKNAHRFDGASWATLNFSTTSLAVGDVAPISNSDAWVVTRDKTFRYNGTGFTAVPNPVSATTTYLYSAAAVSASHVWAGGELGTMLFFDGNAWSAKQSGVTTRIKGIRAASTSLAYAYGDFGVIKWNGNAWGPTGRTTTTHKVWPESATTFWVVGPGELKRWDGAQFVDMAPWLTGAGFNISDVGGGAGDVFVIGDNSEILKRQ
jgi:hypothetical protein